LTKYPNERKIGFKKSRKETNNPIKQKDQIMSYTKAQEAAIVEASPMDLAGAKALGLTLDKSYRSVIAKAKQLGQDYIAKPAPAKAEKAETKAEIVAELAGVLEMSLDGLEKAPLGTLAALRDRLA
jgi:hypothetical protein